jgi:predicted nucleotidyltransferase
MDLDLPADWLRAVVELIGRHAPQAEVWAYGSRVTGGSREGSDLDLVVRNPADLRAEEPALGRLIRAFIDSDLPIIVEVHDWARLPAAFQREIERTHVVLPKVESKIR